MMSCYNKGLQLDQPLATAQCVSFIPLPVRSTPVVLLPGLDSKFQNVHI